MKRTELLAALDRLLVLEKRDRDTRDSYASVVAQFWQWCIGQGAALAPVTEDRVSGYLGAHAERWAVSTQRVHLCGLVKAFRAVGKPLGRLPEWTAAKRPRRLPEWLSDQELRAVIDMLRGEDRMACALMGGGGLRRNEAVSLRLRDLNFQEGSVTVRQGKGDKDRTTCLPRMIADELMMQMERARAVWREDRAEGRPGIYVPDAILHKQPNAGKEERYFWLFPARNLSHDPATGIMRRHHLHYDSVRTALGKAARRCGILRSVRCHTLRHTFATQYLLNGGSIHELQELLGHASIQTTEVYLHCLPMLGGRVRSPLDAAPSKVVHFPVQPALPRPNSAAL